MTRLWMNCKSIGWYTPPNQFGGMVNDIHIFMGMRESERNLPKSIELRVNSIQFSTMTKLSIVPFILSNHAKFPFSLCVCCVRVCMYVWFIFISFTRLKMGILSLVIKKWCLLFDVTTFIFFFFSIDQQLIWLIFESFLIFSSGWFTPFLSLCSFYCMRYGNGGRQYYHICCCCCSICWQAMQTKRSNDHHTKWNKKPRWVSEWEKYGNWT